MENSECKKIYEKKKKGEQNLHKLFINLEKGKCWYFFRPKLEVVWQPDIGIG